MKLGLMQPYLFPYIGYFQLLNAVDTYVVYDDVQFIKGGWINRNNILIGSQKVLFTLRLSGASSNKNINEVNLGDDFNKFLKTINMAYSRAPHRERTMELLQKICSYEDKNLARFAGNSITEIAKYLDIRTSIIYSSSIEKDKGLSAQAKVTAVCKAMRVDTYVNAIGGRGMYGAKEFLREGVVLKFLQPSLRTYPQSAKDFVPGLSIIDILMWNSVDDIKVMLEDYELV